MKQVWQATLGLGLLGTWAAWIIMLFVGALAGLDVVNGTVGFVDALPLGFGFILLGFCPLVGVILAAVGDATRGPDH